MMNTQDMKDYRPPLTEKINELAKKGFETQFKFENGALKDRTSDKNYQAQELSIIEEYRFEGESNPDDMSILYALEARDGTKGIVVNAYGTYSDDDLGDFMKRVKEKGKLQGVKK
ncbi:hypothetical protein OKW21_000294 [Catalinimonas alkaloidigena]|uniref:hypothetical protein n=1 Tax=Catalinimonas alkaloidigena TaxID=1075417 RepID=UPI0024056C46|nr:hypothetical protein [Catalinimonas alkaloidigena]MDF9795031.1 hypothetical protein [Catalinimonas alkaloidigena]